MAPQSTCVWSPAAVSKNASSRLAVSVPFAPSQNSSAWRRNPRTPTPYLTQRTTQFSRPSDGIPSMCSLFASNFDPRLALDWGFGTPYERAYLRTVFSYVPRMDRPSPFNSYRSFTFPFLTFGLHLLSDVPTKMRLAGGVIEKDRCQSKRLRTPDIQGAVGALIE